MTDNTQTEALLQSHETLMAQVQVFASAWAIAGSSFDPGDGMEVAEQEKAILADMTRRLHARIAELEAQLEAIGAGGVSALMGAAKAGSEPVATVFTMEALTPGGGVKYHATIHKPLPAGTKLYAAPQPALSAGWVSVKDRLPPCRDDQDYIGINSAGFAGIFNAVADIAGNVYCMMETAEESVSIMSDLSIWKPFTRPLPVEPSMDGESNG